MKISVVIPTYEAYGRGVEFTSRAVNSVLQQVDVDVEVIISDHSQDEAICDYVSRLSDPRVVYVRNDLNRGNSSANLNNAIKHSSGDIIKPIFMDDYLCNPYALRLIKNKFLNDAKWVVCGSNTSKDGMTSYGDFIPRWNDNIIFGINTLSSPSCIAYKSCNIKWDERLIWLMDCKFYHDIANIFGLPTIEKEILVTNFAHPQQLTLTMGNERKHHETELMKREYGKRNRHSYSR